MTSLAGPNQWWGRAVIIRGCCRLRGHAVRPSRVRFSPAEGGNYLLHNRTNLFFIFGVWTWMSNMIERVQESWWDRLQHHLTLLGYQHPLKSSCFICFFKTFTFSWHPLTGLSPPPDFGAFVLFYWATCVSDVAPSSGENITDLLQHLKSWTSLVQLCASWWRKEEGSVSSPYFKVPKICPVFLFSCFVFEFFCSVAAHFILSRTFYAYLWPTSCLTLRRHACMFHLNPLDGSTKPQHKDNHFLDQSK